MRTEFPIKDAILKDIIREITREILSIENLDWHKVGDEGEPSFSGDWVNKGDGYYDASFARDILNRVHLRGLVEGTVGAVIFTLPENFRPKRKLAFFVCSTKVGGGTVSDGKVVIDTNGEVSFITP